MRAAASNSVVKPAVLETAAAAPADPTVAVRAGDQPPEAAASTSAADPAATHTAGAPVNPDALLIEILDAPLWPGEPALVGFARKEQELRAAFAALPVSDQRALARRLSMPRPDDRLAQKFGRLTAERRTRLIQFLEDARRRAALAKGKA